MRSLFDLGSRPRHSPAGRASSRLASALRAEQEPDPPRVLEWAPGRRGLVALAVIAALSVLVTVLWVWAGRPKADAVRATGSTATLMPTAAVSPTRARSSGSGLPGSAGSGLPRASGTAPAGSAGTAATSGLPSSTDPAAAGPVTQSAGSTVPTVLVVDVAGKVRKPGVYRLPAGSRVGDAIARAGGPLPGTDLSAVNLARPLRDGEQVAFGVAGAPDAAGSGGGATGANQIGTTGTGSGQPVDLNTATATELDALPGVGPALAQKIVDYRAVHGRFGSVQDLNDVSGIGPAKFAELQAKVSV